MNSLIASMNDILKNWKKEYDLFSAISSEFSVNNGSVCFANHPLCLAEDDLVISSADFDAESIQYFLNRNCSIYISVSWPEDQPPEVSYCAFVQYFGKGKPA